MRKQLRGKAIGEAREEVVDPNGGAEDKTKNLGESMEYQYRIQSKRERKSKPKIWCSVCKAEQIDR